MPFLKATLTHTPITAAPWVLVLILCTDVEPQGGPTALLPGSHLIMSRLLAHAPPKSLLVHKMFSLCAAVAASAGPQSIERATGRAGDV